MKVLSALLSAVVLFGFAGAAAAQCSGYSKSSTTAQSQIILPEGGAGS